MNKLTEENFEYFKTRCEHWLEVLSLKSWKVYYHFEYDKETLASFRANYEGRTATIWLSTKWRADISKDELDESALHECLEVFLSPLTAQAEARAWDKSEYEQEHHMVIRVLEKLLRKGKNG